VVADEGRVLGMITATVLLQALTRYLAKDNLAGLTIADWVQEVPFLRTEMGAVQIWQQFEHCTLPVLPQVSPEGALVAIVERPPQTPDLSLQLAEQSPNPIFAVDRQGRLLTWNPACKALFNGADSLRMQSIQDLLEPQIENYTLRSLLRRVWAGECLNNLEITYQSVGQGSRVMLSRVYPLYGPDGTVHQCAFANTDITFLKQAAAYLQTEEQRFRAIFDQSPVGFCQTDLNGVIQWANPGFAEFLGYKVADLVGRTFQSLTWPEDLSQDLALNQSLLAQERESFTLEKRYLAQDGSARWANITVCCLKHSQGQPYATLSVVQDIGDRKAAEWALQQSEERYALAVSEGQVGVWDWDIHSGEIYLSPSLKGLLGYTDGEITNHIDDWFTYVYPEDQAPLQTMVDAVLAGECDRLEMPHRMIHKDGSLRWILMRGRVFRTPDGKAQRMAGTDTDITALKQAELALRASHQQVADILESITDGFFALNQDLHFTYLNQRAEEMLFCRREDVLGHQIWEKFPEAKGTLFQTAYETALAEQVTQTFEAYYPPFQTWYEVHAYPTPTGLAVYFQTVTERKLAYERLAHQVKREQAFNQVIQAIHQSLDLETIFSTAAQAMQPLLEVDRLSIVQYEAETALWRIMAIYNRRPGETFAAGDVIADQDNPLAERLRNFETVQVDDSIVLTDPVNRQLTAERSESWLLIPLQVAGSPLPWGSLSLSRCRDRDRPGWQANEVELAQTLAHQLAIAIQQAQTYDQAQQDLVERERAEARLREAQQLARLGNWELQMNPPTWLWSEQMLALFDLPPTASPPTLQEQLAYIHPDDRDLWQGTWEVAQVTGEAFEMECRLQLETTPCRYVSLLGQGEWDEQGQVTRLFGTLMDITERRQFEDQLAYEAYHDPLTGTPNRALFMEHLQAASEQAQLTPQSYAFAILFIDLDRFKIINDTLGHLSGDRLLMACANRLATLTRPNDVFARLSGDEFALLLDDIPNLTWAIAQAEQIQTLLEQPFLLEGRELFVTASIGVASSLGGSVDPVDCLRDADIAMFQAKRQGRNRHVLFDPVMHAENTTRLILETDLQRAIDRDELQVVYQPIMRLPTRQVSGFEALVRWHHPHFGPIQPGEFIPLAEESGAILHIGRWIRDRACAQLKRWQQSLPQAATLTMSVNLSVKQFASLRLLDRIQETLTRTGLKGRYLRLEITESALIDNPEMAAVILHNLRKQDIQLCIDDFGTGYSSLSMVHQYPVQVLKIDRSFVNRLEADHRGVAMVRTIIALAHSLDMEVIAEGVETAEQLRILEELGCESAQGFYFACPLSAREAADWLTAPPNWWQ
jgi:diguanylate cyclase (GGDEF)-like protein/PAS domain S-box-containing protein